MDEWVYVPKEATKEMLKAGEAWSGLPSATWSDMVDAAPVSDDDQLTVFLQEAYAQGYQESNESIESLKIALQPFRSGGDWGVIKALLVSYGNPDQARLAKKLTEWQVKVDEALMALDKRSSFEEERGDWYGF